MPTILIRLSRWLCVSVLLAGCTAQGSTLPPMPMTPVVSIAASGPVPPADYFTTPAPLPTTTPTPRATPTPRVSPTPTATPEPVILNGPLTVALDNGLPEEWAGPLMATLNQIKQVEAANGPQPLQLLDQVDHAQVVIEAGSWGDGEVALAQRFFAVVAPFATIRDDISFEELQLRWQGLSDGGPLLASSATLQLLEPVLGEANAVTVEPRDLLRQLEETPDALGLLPFDQIDPRFKVLTIDGINILDNQFDPATYPLISMLHLRGKEFPLLIPLLSGVITPATNRNAAELTTLIMTGVTAMSRGTADAIERNYLTYPAAIISSTLAAADITHISNEVPFLEDCVVNNTANNLVLCSHTSYWEVLEAVGTDIVGLSGNHVNDFGYDGARASITFYRENNIPIYGSGLNVTEACEPLFWEHNGNTFAFVAALAFGPETAWATDELPGACYYYDRKEEMLALVKELAAEVDIVAVELQYLEIYEPSPTFQQVTEFRELREAGADIVTGVQSHVPQAWETYGNNDPGGPGTISYGLGNLFFDQMWSWETRTEQMARHTIYQGRVLNTEILTAVLEDYAQPRWATPEERANILNRVFNAAPPRP
jgi:poly-gamma-glutamate capsule biosynthesis protein CapA/YwtB (metallophosphatase superfamily)